MFTQLSLDDAADQRPEIVHAYLDAFMHDNALNPMVFPALRQIFTQLCSARITDENTFSIPLGGANAL